MLVRFIYILNHPASSSDDARLYFRATQEWLAGGDPRTVRSDAGFLFAAPPPCLLLSSLPLLPFGENVAALFWPVAGLAAAVLAIRHYRPPRWWIMWPPYTGSIWPGSPDLALLGLTLAGAGAISGMTKVYSLPGMLGEGRWRAVLAAALLGLITLPILHGAASLPSSGPPPAPWPPNPPTRFSCPRS
jgi:hypothetical protein